MDLALLGDLATGGGTLVLAIATFASVRSANKSARTAERALAAGLRPLLMQSRRDDELQKVRFGDGVFLRTPGGFGAIDVTDDVVYLAMNLRNVGPGIGVIHGWYVVTGTEHDLAFGSSADLRQSDPAPVEHFRIQQRDMYVPSGDSGFWQGALRDVRDPAREAVCAQVEAGESVTVDLLYGDYEGGQRTITRFVLTPLPDHGHLLSVIRHWQLEGAHPR